MDDQQQAKAAGTTASTPLTIIQKSFVFKQNVDPVLLNKFKQQEKISKDSLISQSFSVDNFQKSTFRKLLPYIKQWVNQSNLSIQNRKFPTLLNQISPIQFTSLIYLYLGNNNIRNVQSVANLDAPNLIKLYLYHNQIRSFKALHKAKLPKLFRVSLYDNKFCQLQKFQDILWDSKQIEWISLEDTNINDITYDHIKILKISSPVRQLWINSNYRINNKALKMFDKKFPGHMMHYPENKNN